MGMDMMCLCVCVHISNSRRPTHPIEGFLGFVTLNLLKKYCNIFIIPIFKKYAKEVYEAIEKIKINFS